MAIGFTPNYIGNIKIEDITKEEFLALLVEVAIKMGFEIEYLSGNGMIAYMKKGVFSYNSQIRVTVQDDIAIVKSSSTGREVIDFGKNKKSVQNFIEVFSELKTKFTSEDLQVKFKELENKLIPEEDDILKPVPQTILQKVAGLFSIFKPKQGYFITPILVNLNILIFIIMLFSGVDWMSPTTDSLIHWGANFRPVTLDGQWYRLFTSCFIHIGIVHLLMNMYALIFIGSLLEPYLGKSRFLSAYLSTGLLGSIASLLWNDLTVSAGASGAIFGMYGVFLVLLTTDLIENEKRKALLSSIVIFVGYNLVYGLKEGIDNAAHIGGLIGGLIIGYIYINFFEDEDDQALKFKVMGGLAVFFSVISFTILSMLSNDIVEYDRRMHEFVEMESMALEIYHQVNYLPKEDLLYNINDRGIYYWNESINLIDELDKMDLPDIIHQRNSKIKNYCELRIKSFELIYKAVSEDTDNYQKEIQDLDAKIQAIVEELKK